MKKILLLLVLFIPFKVWASDLATNAYSGILIEYSTGKVLFEKTANEKMAPASMTKIMTLLLIMEALEEGKINLNDMIPVSANAASMGGSQVFLQPNTEIKCEELIKSVAIASANDVVVIKKQSQVIGEEITI